MRLSHKWSLQCRQTVPAQSISTAIWPKSFGIYQIGNDIELLKHVTSANAACGFHAGDPVTMMRFAALARDAGISLGAHPGFHDLEGFGRRPIAMDFDEIKAMVIYQIAALQGLAKSAGISVTHVKPHGALSNLAAKDRTYAQAIAEAIRQLDTELIYVVQFGSQMHEIACELEMKFAREGYADRRYGDDGNLASRHIEDAVIADPQAAARQALDMVLNNQVRALSGKTLNIHVDTICVHSDKPSAVPVACEVRRALHNSGIAVIPLDHMTLPESKTCSAQSSTLTG